MYGAIFRNVLWPFWETTLHGRRTPSYLKELEQTQWLSPAETRARQQQRQREIVAHAIRQVPFYRDRYAEAGITPERCVEDWTRIPLLTKADLRAQGKELIARDWRNKRLIHNGSSGSTGAPVEFWYDRDCYDRRIAGWYRADSWAGWRLGEPHIMFWNAVGRGVGERPRREVWNERLHWLALRWSTCTISRMGRDRIRRYYSTMCRVKPRTVFGYSNAMYTVACVLQELGLQPPPVRGVIVSGEKIFPHQKAKIEEVFRARVFERYGCNEVCNIACECDRHHGMHINADALYLEVLRDDGAPCAPGETGQIVLTYFDNLAMPLIRYPLGDRGSLAGHDCLCGRGLPLLREVAGRELDMIRTPEGSICAGMLFMQVMKEFHHVRGFQLVQETLDRLRLRLVTDSPLTRNDISYMEQELRRYLGPTMRIGMEFVEQLETSANGKYKMVISKVKV